MKLNKEQRAFLDHIQRAAFSNPFSSDRVNLDRDLLGNTVNPDKLRGSELAERVESTMRAVGKKSAEAPPFTVMTGPDRRRMFIAHLFISYYRLADLFDAVIEESLRRPDAPPPKLTFAAKAIRDLRQRGLSPERAERAFTIFYQLRRASWLINHYLPGRSQCMQNLRGNLWNTLFSEDILFYETHLWNRMDDFSVLLLGETGTGKGMAARALGGAGYLPFDADNHRFQDSFHRSFIGINLSQFPESLIESALFGHRKGAFTGAIAHHDGVFKRCRPNGILFLDEIGDVSPQVQIKLLNVLQDRLFTPVGSAEALPFEGRVIAATHRHLGTLRTEGKFRDDFYYRLCSNEIVVPTLRQRIAEHPGELEQLVSILLERTTGETNPDRILTALKRDLPAHYPWPGNVRELEQAIRRVLVTGHYTGDCRPGSDGLAETLRNGELSLAEVSARYCKMLYERFGSYEEVARRAGIDRRTAKKHVQSE